MNRDEREIANMLEELVVYERTPSKSALSRELVIVLEEALERLEKELGQVIRWRYMEGLEMGVIARRMNCCERSVQRMCCEGLKQLRRMVIEALG